VPPAPEGSIPLVPTSKTPQPHAQANAAPGAKTPATKPTPAFFIGEFKFLFFIFKVKDCENAPRRSQIKGMNFAHVSRRWLKYREDYVKQPRGGGTGGLAKAESAKSATGEKTENGFGEMRANFAAAGGNSIFKQR